MRGSPLKIIGSGLCNDALFNRALISGEVTEDGVNCLCLNSKDIYLQLEF